MALRDIKAIKQGLVPQAVFDALQELQGIRVAVVAGAAAATKMNVAALRSEDTVLSVLHWLDAAASVNTPADDVANVTISETRASGTITASAVADADTCVVNGTTYTCKTTPTLLNHFKRTAGDNNANALALKNAINAFESRTLTTKRNIPGVVATVSSAVVTIFSVTDGAGNAPNCSNSAHCVITNNQTADVSGTVVSVVNGNTVTVNGVVFTIRTTPTAGLLTDILAGGTDTAMATKIANAVNVYESKFGTLDVSCTTVTTVVHFAPRTYKKGNIIVLTGTANLAASGSGVLANGTATGGFTSATNLSSRTCVVLWFNKQ